MSRPGSDEELMSPSSFTWSNTVCCTRTWSDDELLSNLCSMAFTIPPRDYNPSAPFVYVTTEDGLITTLPHGYRIPLMFVAKYQWETIFRTLSLQNRHNWEAVRDEILHLSRQCHDLFFKARAKAESGGMEKGWRCANFDRILTRFYKGWPVCSPAKHQHFISHFGYKEYDRDVLKNDWKRWALKGFFRPPSSSPSIHLTEDEVNNGITAADFIMPLSKIDNVWTLSTKTKNNHFKRRPIKFMQPAEASSSELTDFDLSEDDDEDEGDENTNLDRHPPSLKETPTKRSREPSEDDDTRNRSGKRAKLEDIVRSISSLPCSPIVLPRPLDSEDVADEEHDPLPKFRVPRQILFSYGWKPLSATDSLASRRQREREEEAGTGTGTDVLPACGSDDPSTSTLPSSELTSSLPSAKYPSDYPSSNVAPSISLSIRSYNDTPYQSQPNELPPYPNSTSISSKSKGKQPESASTNFTSAATSTATTGHTFRPPRNSVHVSLPSSSRMMKICARLPGSAAATLPPPSPKPLSPPMTRGRGGGVGSDTDSSRNSVPPPLSSELPSPVAGKELGEGRQRIENCCVKSTLDPWRERIYPTGAGADGDINMNRKEEKAEVKQDAKNVEESKIVGIQHSEPSSSSSSMITTSMNMEANNDNGECGEQEATSTAISAPPELELADCLPEPIRSTSSISSTSSSSLSSLSSSVTPSPSGPSVSNSGDVAVAADAAAGVEYGTQSVKDRIRELKTRFLTFRDDLERIITRLEVLEGGEDGDLSQEGVNGGSSDHLSFVSQTEDKRKQKDKESDLDIVSESGGAIPGYVDAAVGIYADALVALRDVSVQTVDVDSATPLHSTDDLSNVTKNLGKIKPTLSLESKTDENIPPPTQFVNTTSLSTMVDNLVSIKMLSMMQTLVKSGSSNGKAKLVEPSAATKPDSDLICQPSPSSSSLSISAASHPAYDSIISSLLDELKTIKQEARCREQSEKEDLLAMRQLHSAEVDALRGRLSYLESKDLGLDRWDLNNGGGARRWKGSRVDDSLDLDRHRHPHRLFEDGGTSHPFRRHRSQPFEENGLAHYSSGSTSIVNPEGASTSTTTTNTTTTPLSLRKPNSLSLPPLSITSSTATADSTISPSLPTPTPATPSGKRYPFGFSKNNNNHYYGMGMGMDLDDDGMVNVPLPLPLPIKSQRKHHIMALARNHFY